MVLALPETKFYPEEGLTALNRAFQFGDGVFETMYVSRGQIRLEQKHWERLREASERLSLNIDFEHLGTLTQDYTAGIEKGVCKLLVSRGSNQGGFFPQNALPLKYCLSARKAPESWMKSPEQGIESAIGQFKLGIQPAFAGIKHCNRLEQVFCAQEVQQSAYKELVFLNHDGLVIEGSCSNLFMIKGDTLYTPVLNRSGVNGVVRRWVIEHAESWNMRLKEEHISPDKLYSAQEVFLSSSVQGIVPVTKVGQKKFESVSQALSIQQDFQLLTS